MIVCPHCDRHVDERYSVERTVREAEVVVEQSWWHLKCWDLHWGTKRRKKVTQADVANAIGYSQSTVSSALRPGTAKYRRLDPETRALVEQAAKRLGYVWEGNKKPRQ